MTAVYTVIVAISAIILVAAAIWSNWRWQRKVRKTLYDDIIKNRGQRYVRCADGSFRPVCDGGSVHPQDTITTDKITNV